jgi:RNA polymerase sigma factor (TIGR02999 family)
MTLTVRGTGFVSGSVVQFNGSTLKTLFQYGCLAADISPSLIAAPTVAIITVLNPDGTISNGVNMVVGETTADPSQVTGLLIAWSKGDRAALDELTPLIYRELYRMAKRYMSQEHPGHTLQTTALINEAYIRLVGASGITWQNRAQFFSVAAKVMRHVLVDHARKVSSLKRGKDWQPVPIDNAIVISPERIGEMIALDDALSLLEEVHPRQAQVVELRFFGGMSVDEVAEHLKVSPETVARDWRAAKAWLYRELRG